VPFTIWPALCAATGEVRPTDRATAPAIRELRFMAIVLPFETMLTQRSNDGRVPSFGAQQRASHALIYFFLLGNILRLQSNYTAPKFRLFAHRLSLLKEVPCRGRRPALSRCYGAGFRVGLFRTARPARAK